MYGLEQEVRSQILGEQSQKFKLQKDALDTQIEKLNDYKNHISQIVKEKFAADTDAMLVMLKKKTEEAANIDQETSMYKPPALYPGTGTSKYRKQGTITAPSGLSSMPYGGATVGEQGTTGPQGRLVSSELQVVGTMPGSVVPKNFQHYSYCQCFVPNSNYPNYTMNNAEMTMLSE